MEKDRARRRTPWPVLLLRASVLGLGLVYAVSLLPSTSTGFDPLLDGWVNNLVTVGVAALLVQRGRSQPDGRAPWYCFAAATTAWQLGSFAYYVHYRLLPEIPYPSWSDVGWIAFYPLAYAAVFLLLRQRVERLNASMWLDGLVTGLATASLAVAFALGPALQVGEGSAAVVATSFAYPVADVLLLVLVAGALSVIGRGAGAAWWWTSGGIALFALTDTVYAFQVARGTYVDGGPLDLGWLLAFQCFGLAAWQSPRSGSARRIEGLRVLLLPAVSAVAALGVLFHGFLTTGHAVAGALALAAVLTALARTALTFREVRALADSRRQARTDELTGLPNRRRAYEVLEGLEAQLAAGGTVALLMVDLDRFKEINDSLGHAAGDALLRQVGPRLAPVLRPDDLLARLGGDEFVVVSTGLDADGAAALATRMRAELQRPFEVTAMSLTIDASIGITVGPSHATDGEELLQLADLAMYSAKALRTGTAVYDEVRDGGARHRLETVEQLRAGLDRGELELHYQPKIALRSGAVTGVEALVRWQHPERGLLYPDAFIELAESFGLMSRLTLRVLDQALAQCRTWHDDGLALSVAVNVSPSNLVDEHFPDEVTELLGRHAVRPQALVLEVTESLLMEDRVRAVAVLTRLRELGVGIAIDDYGTGYSSLAYLAELPVTELKLDRAFTGALTGSARTRAIVTSTLQLAHALGLVLVAEGAEDQATVDALTSLGCDVVQGYHVSRPLPPDRLAGWLAARLRAVPAPSGPTKGIPAQEVPVGA